MAEQRFEYYKAADGWRWRFRAGNGEIIASGEAYASLQMLKHAIEVIQHGSIHAKVGPADECIIADIEAEGDN